MLLRPWAGFIAPISSHTSSLVQNRGELCGSKGDVLRLQFALMVPVLCHQLVMASMPACGDFEPSSTPSLQSSYRSHHSLRISQSWRPPTTAKLYEQTRLSVISTIHYLCYLLKYNKVPSMPNRLQARSRTAKMIKFSFAALRLRTASSDFWMTRIVSATRRSRTSSARTIQICIVDCLEIRASSQRGEAWTTRLAITRLRLHSSQVVCQQPVTSELSAAHLRITSYSLFFSRSSDLWCLPYLVSMPKSNRYVTDRVQAAMF